MKKNRTITRRDFLRGTAYAAFAAALGPSLGGEAKAEEKVKVVLIRDENAIDQQGNINQKIVQKMLDQGTCELLGEENPIQAWKTFSGCCEKEEPVYEVPQGPHHPGSRRRFESGVGKPRTWDDR